MVNEKIVQLMAVMGYIILGLMLCIALYLSADFMLSRIPASRAVMGYAEDGITVYVLSNGVHTDIVMPVRQDSMKWDLVFPFGNTKGRDTVQNWVAIGWGDKGFYLNTPEWKDLKLKTALVAGLGIGETALHVTYYKAMSENQLCRRTQVTPAQYRRLVSYVLASLKTNAHGEAIRIETNAQYNEDDAFYEAKGAYSLIFSCNTWTNNALKYANMPAGVWTVFDGGILQYYPSQENPK
ncbi:TIGR02117 family protein [Sphingobacterium griseoflavum]|uniref:Urease-associated protein n=1 Tax=Sphingobacterium griseoflavum TaxID=1474952 RepID=A0ABQ3HXJ9_9SPHI|nr:TIGR02117 family protein [Sphingobacterium griseoflavum]GHE37717.1 hypothetical protein GCM10017764_21310 [Sphingobacterium griseoflavum]